MKKKKIKLIYAGYEIEIEGNKVTLYEKKNRKTKDEAALKILDYLIQEGFFTAKQAKNIEITIVSD